MRRALRSYKSSWAALLALGVLKDRVEADADEVLRQRARELTGDPHRGVRLEAEALVEEHIGAWLDEANRAALEAKLARADSLFHRAVAFFPASRRANFQLARFCTENDRREEGLARLREHGMLLEVPLLRRAPVIDGHMDEEAWRGALRADTLYQYTRSHQAALLSEVVTTLYLGRFSTGLYAGVVCHDSHPDSLVVGLSERDDPTEFAWEEDRIEFFYDTNLDRRGYVHIAINSEGTVADGWFPNGLLRAGADEDWDLDCQIATHVGEAAWYVEIRVALDQPHMGVPDTGALWGFNFVRVFRGSEFSQWMRTYGRTAHTPAEFGLLAFL